MAEGGVIRPPRVLGRFATCGIRWEGVSPILAGQLYTAFNQSPFSFAWVPNLSSVWDRLAAALGERRSRADGGCLGA